MSNRRKKRTYCIIIEKCKLVHVRFELPFPVRDVQFTMGHVTFVRVRVRKVRRKRHDNKFLCLLNIESPSWIVVISCAVHIYSISNVKFHT